MHLHVCVVNGATRVTCSRGMELWRAITVLKNNERCIKWNIIIKTMSHHRPVTMTCLSVLVMNIQLVAVQHQNLADGVCMGPHFFASREGFSDAQNQRQYHVLLLKHTA